MKKNFVLKALLVFTLSLLMFAFVACDENTSEKGGSSSDDPGTKQEETVTRTVYIYNGSSVYSGTYKDGDVISLTANVPDDEVFVCWKENNQVKSYETEIDYPVDKNAVLHAVFSKNVELTLAAGDGTFSIPSKAYVLKGDDKTRKEEAVVSYAIGGTPEITGRLAVGQTVSAYTASLSGGCDAFSFVWEKSTDGTTFVAIDGATERDYTLQEGEADCYLRVTVTGKDGYFKSVSSEKTAQKVTSAAAVSQAELLEASGKVGTATTDLIQVVAVQGCYFRLPVPSCPNKTFVGWYAGEKQMTDEKGVSIVSADEETTSLMAKFEENAKTTIGFYIANPVDGVLTISEKSTQDYFLEENYVGVVADTLEDRKCIGWYPLTILGKSNTAPSDWQEKYQSYFIESGNTFVENTSDQWDKEKAYAVYGEAIASDTSTRLEILFTKEDKDKTSLYVALYQEAYHINVVGGQGGGYYQGQDKIEIEAIETVGKKFERWSFVSGDKTYYIGYVGEKIAICDEDGNVTYKNDDNNVVTEECTCSFKIQTAFTLNDLAALHVDVEGGFRINAEFSSEIYLLTYELNANVNGNYIFENSKNITEKDGKRTLVIGNFTFIDVKDENGYDNIYTCELEMNYNQIISLASSLAVEHYEFDSWQPEKGGTIPSTMPQESVTLVGTYHAERFAVSVSAGAHGDARIGTRTGVTSGLYDYHSTINIFVTAAKGYDFNGWTYDAQNLSLEGKKDGDRDIIMLAEEPIYGETVLYKYTYYVTGASEDEPDKRITANFTERSYDIKYRYHISYDGDDVTGEDYFQEYTYITVPVIDETTTYQEVNEYLAQKSLSYECIKEGVISVGELDTVTVNGKTFYKAPVEEKDGVSFVLLTTGSGEEEKFIVKSKKYLSDADGKGYLLLTVKDSATYSTVDALLGTNGTAIGDDTIDWDKTETVTLGGTQYYRLTVQDGDDKFFVLCVKGEDNKAGFVYANEIDTAICGYLVEFSAYVVLTFSKDTVTYEDVNILLHLENFAAKCDVQNENDLVSGIQKTVGGKNYIAILLTDGQYVLYDNSEKTRTCANWLEGNVEDGFLRKTIYFSVMPSDNYCYLTVSLPSNATVQTVADLLRQYGYDCEVSEGADSLCVDKDEVTLEVMEDDYSVLKKNYRKITVLLDGKECAVFVYIADDIEVAWVRSEQKTEGFYRQTEIVIGATEQKRYNSTSGDTDSVQNLVRQFAPSELSLLYTEKNENNTVWSVGEWESSVKGIDSSSVGFKMPMQSVYAAYTVSIRTYQMKLASSQEMTQSLTVVSINGRDASCYPLSTDNYYTIPYGSEISTVLVTKEGFKNYEINCSGESFPWVKTVPEEYHFVIDFHFTCSGKMTITYNSSRNANQFELYIGFDSDNESPKDILINAFGLNLDQSVEYDGYTYYFYGYYSTATNHLTEYNSDITFPKLSKDFATELEFCHYTHKNDVWTTVYASQKDLDTYMTVYSGSTMPDRDLYGFALLTVEKEKVQVKPEGAGTWIFNEEDDDMDIRLLSGNYSSSQVKTGNGTVYTTDYYTPYTFGYVLPTGYHFDHWSVNVYREGSSTSNVATELSKKVWYTGIRYLTVSVTEDLLTNWNTKKKNYYYKDGDEYHTYNDDDAEPKDVVVYQQITCSYNDFPSDWLTGYADYTRNVFTQCTVNTAYSTSANYWVKTYLPLDAEPSDFAENYGSYFVKENDNFVPVTSSDWVANQQYYYEGYQKESISKSIFENDKSHYYVSEKSTYWYSLSTVPDENLGYDVTYLTLYIEGDVFVKAEFAKDIKTATVAIGAIEEPLSGSLLANWDARKKDAYTAIQLTKSTDVNSGIYSSDVTNTMSFEYGNAIKLDLVSAKIPSGQKLSEIRIYKAKGDTFNASDYTEDDLLDAFSEGALDEDKVIELKDSYLYTATEYYVTDKKYTKNVSMIRDDIFVVLYYELISYKINYKLYTGVSDFEKDSLGDILTLSASQSTEEKFSMYYYDYYETPRFGGYGSLSEEPSDWDTAWTKYYEKVNGVYTQLSGEKPEWQADTYYYSNLLQKEEVFGLLTNEQISACSADGKDSLLFVGWFNQDLSMSLIDGVQVASYEHKTSKNDITFYGALVDLYTFADLTEDTCAVAFNTFLQNNFPNWYTTAIDKLIMPKKNGEKTVTQYGYADETSQNRGFAQNSKIKTLLIPAQVETIFDETFQGCTSLTELSFEEGTKSIQAKAFKNCKGINEVSFPDTLQNIGEESFSGTSLTQIYIKNTIRSIGQLAFGNQQQSSFSVYYDGINSDKCDLTGFGSDAYKGIFGYSKDATTISFTIGKSVEVFYNGITKGIVQKITSLTIEEGEDFTDLSILEKSFQNSGLETLSVGKRLVLLGESVFADSSSLTEVIFAEDSRITAIPASCFASCSSLQTVTLGEKLETIGDRAFQSAVALSTVYYRYFKKDGSYGLINDTKKFIYLTSIGQYAFEGTALSTFTDIDKSEEGIYFPYSGSYQSSGYDVSTLTVKAHAFEQNQAEKITFAAYEIEMTQDSSYQYGQFNGSSQLRTLVYDMEGSAWKNASGTFTFGTSVVSLEISDNVNIIPDNLFYGLGVTSVTIGKNVTKIGEQSFGGILTLQNIYYNCLTSVTVPTAVGKTCFNGSGKANVGAKLFVGSDVSSLPSSLFRGATYITSVDFSKAKSTFTIGSYAFYEQRITTITFAGSGIENLTIGAYAFYDESAAETNYFQNVIIPTTVSSVTFSVNSFNYAGNYNEFTVAGITRNNTVLPLSVSAGTIRFVKQSDDDYNAIVNSDSTIVIRTPLTLSGDEDVCNRLQVYGTVELNNDLTVYGDVELLEEGSVSYGDYFVNGMVKTWDGYDERTSKDGSDKPKAYNKVTFDNAITLDKPRTIDTSEGNTNIKEVEFKALTLEEGASLTISQKVIFTGDVTVSAGSTFAGQKEKMYVGTQTVTIASGATLVLDSKTYFTKQEEQAGFCLADGSTVSLTSSDSQKSIADGLLFNVQGNLSTLSEMTLSDKEDFTVDSGILTVSHDSGFETFTLGETATVTVGTGKQVSFRTPTASYDEKITAGAYILRGSKDYYFDTFNLAISNSQNQETVKVLRDQNITDFAIDKTLTVDLNQMTLTVPTLSATSVMTLSGTNIIFSTGSIAVTCSLPTNSSLIKQTSGTLSLRYVTVTMQDGTVIDAPSGTQLEISNSTFTVSSGSAPAIKTGTDSTFIDTTTMTVQQGIYLAGGSLSLEDVNITAQSYTLYTDADTKTGATVSVIAKNADSSLQSNTTAVYLENTQQDSQSFIFQGTNGKTLSVSGADSAIRIRTGHLSLKGTVNLSSTKERQSAMSTQTGALVMEEKASWTSNFYYDSNYALLEDKPGDWDENWQDYYIKQTVYTSLQGESEKPTWKASTFYTMSKQTVLSGKPTDWETNWKYYLIKSGNSYSFLGGSLAPTFTSNTYYTPTYSVISSSDWSSMTSAEWAKAYRKDSYRHPYVITGESLSVSAENTVCISNSAYRGDCIMHDTTSVTVSGLTYSVHKNAITGVYGECSRVVDATPIIYNKYGLKILVQKDVCTSQFEQIMYYTDIISALTMVRTGERLTSNEECTLSQAVTLSENVIWKANASVVANKSLTINGTMDISGNLTANDQVTTGSNSSIEITGSLWANKTFTQNGSLTVGATVYTKTTWLGNGIINAEEIQVNGGTMTMGTSSQLTIRTLTIATGTTMTTGGEVTANGNTTINGTLRIQGKWTGEGSSAILTDNNALQISGSGSKVATEKVIMKSKASFTVGTGSSAELNAITMASTGTVSISGTLTMKKGYTLNGTVTIAGRLEGTYAVQNSGTVAITGAMTVGTFTNSGSVTVTSGSIGATSVTNNGAILVDQSGAANITGTVTNNAGSSFIILSSVSKNTIGKVLLNTVSNGTTNCCYTVLPEGITVQYNAKSVYVELEEEPSDWQTNYGAYYVRKHIDTAVAPTWQNHTYYQEVYTLLVKDPIPSEWGMAYQVYYKKVNNQYVPLSSSDPWENEFYYSKSYEILTTKPDNWDTNWTDYYYGTYEQVSAETEWTGGTFFTDRYVRSKKQVSLNGTLQALYLYSYYDARESSEVVKENCQQMSYTYSSYSVTYSFSASSGTYQCTVSEGGTNGIHWNVSDVYGAHTVTYGTDGSEWIGTHSGTCTVCNAFFRYDHNYTDEIVALQVGDKKILSRYCLQCGGAYIVYESEALSTVSDLKTYLYDRTGSVISLNSSNNWSSTDALNEHIESCETLSGEDKLYFVQTSKSSAYVLIHFDHTKVLADDNNGYTHKTVWDDMFVSEHNKHQVAISEENAISVKAQPADWASNYTNYYLITGSKPNRKQNTDTEWAENTYYDAEGNLVTEQPVDWTTSYVDYYVFDSVWHIAEIYLDEDDNIIISKPSDWDSNYASYRIAVVTQNTDSTWDSAKTYYTGEITKLTAKPDDWEEAGAYQYYYKKGTSGYAQLTTNTTWSNFSTFGYMKYTAIEESKVLCGVCSECGYGDITSPLIYGYDESTKISDIVSYLTLGSFTGLSSTSLVSTKIGSYKQYNGYYLLPVAKKNNVEYYVYTQAIEHQYEYISTSLTSKQHTKVCVTCSGSSTAEDHTPAATPTGFCQLNVQKAGYPDYQNFLCTTCTVCGGTIIFVKTVTDNMTYQTISDDLLATYGYRCDYTDMTQKVYTADTLVINSDTYYRVKIVKIGDETEKGYILLLVEHNWEIGDVWNIDYHSKECSEGDAEKLWVEHVTAGSETSTETVVIQSVSYRVLGKECSDCGNFIPFHVSAEHSISLSDLDNLLSGYNVTVEYSGNKSTTKLWYYIYKNRYKTYPCAYRIGESNTESDYYPVKVSGGDYILVHINEYTIAYASSTKDSEKFAAMFGYTHEGYCSCEQDDCMHIESSHTLSSDITIVDEGIFSAYLCAGNYLVRTCSDCQKNVYVTYLANDNTTYRNVNAYLSSFGYRCVADKPEERIAYDWFYDKESGDYPNHITNNDDFADYWLLPVEEIDGEEEAYIFIRFRHTFIVTTEQGEEGSTDVYICAGCTYHYTERHVYELTKQYHQINAVNELAGTVTVETVDLEAVVRMTVSVLEGEKPNRTEVVKDVMPVYHLNSYTTFDDLSSYFIGVDQWAQKSDSYIGSGYVCLPFGDGSKILESDVERIIYNGTLYYYIPLYSMKNSIFYLEQGEFTSASTLKDVSEEPVLYILAVYDDDTSLDKKGAFYYDNDGTAEKIIREPYISKFGSGLTQENLMVEHGIGASTGGSEDRQFLAEINDDETELVLYSFNETTTTDEINRYFIGKNNITVTDEENHIYTVDGYMTRADDLITTAISSYRESGSLNDLYYIPLYAVQGQVEITDSAITPIYYESTTDPLVNYDCKMSPYPAFYVLGQWKSSTVQDEDRFTFYGTGDTITVSTYQDYLDGTEHTELLTATYSKAKDGDRVLAQIRCDDCADFDDVYVTFNQNATFDTITQYFIGVNGWVSARSEKKADANGYFCYAFNNALSKSQIAGKILDTQYPFATVEKGEETYYLLPMYSYIGQVYYDNEGNILEETTCDEQGLVPSFYLLAKLVEDDSNEAQCSFYYIPTSDNCQGDVDLASFTKPRTKIKLSSVSSTTIDIDLMTASCAGVRKTMIFHYNASTTVEQVLRYFLGAISWEKVDVEFKGMTENWYQAEGYSFIRYGMTQYLEKTFKEYLEDLAEMAETSGKCETVNANIYNETSCYLLPLYYVEKGMIWLEDGIIGSDSSLGKMKAGMPEMYFVAVYDETCEDENGYFYCDVLDESCSASGYVAGSDRSEAFSDDVTVSSKVGTDVLKVTSKVGDDYYLIKMYNGTGEFYTQRGDSLVEKTEMTVAQDTFIYLVGILDESVQDVKFTVKSLADQAVEEDYTVVDFATDGTHFDVSSLQTGNAYSISSYMKNIMMIQEGDSSKVLYCTFNSDTTLKEISQYFVGVEGWDENNDPQIKSPLQRIMQESDIGTKSVSFKEKVIAYDQDDGGYTVTSDIIYLYDDDTLWSDLVMQLITFESKNAENDVAIDVQGFLPCASFDDDFNAGNIKDNVLDYATVVYGTKEYMLIPLYSYEGNVVFTDGSVYENSAGTVSAEQYSYLLARKSSENVNKLMALGANEDTGEEELSELDASTIDCNAITPQNISTDTILTIQDDVGGEAQVAVYRYNSQTTYGDLNQYLIGLKQWASVDTTVYQAEGYIAGGVNEMNNVISSTIRQTIGDITYTLIPLYTFKGNVYLSGKLSLGQNPQVSDDVQAYLLAIQDDTNQKYSVGMLRSQTGYIYSYLPVLSSKVCLDFLEKADFSTKEHIVQDETADEPNIFIYTPEITVECLNRLFIGVDQCEIIATNGTERTLQVRGYVAVDLDIQTNNTMIEDLELETYYYNGTNYKVVPLIAVAGTVVIDGVYNDILEWDTTEFVSYNLTAIDVPTKYHLVKMEECWGSFTETVVISIIPLETIEYVKPRQEYKYQGIAPQDIAQLQASTQTEYMYHVPITGTRYIESDETRATYVVDTLTTFDDVDTYLAENSSFNGYTCLLDGISGDDTVLSWLSGEVAPYDFLIDGTYSIPLALRSDGTKTWCASLEIIIQDGLFDEISGDISTKEQSDANNKLLQVDGKTVVYHISDETTMNDVTKYFIGATGWTYTGRSGDNNENALYMASGYMAGRKLSDDKVVETALKIMDKEGIYYLIPMYSFSNASVSTDYTFTQKPTLSDEPTCYLLAVADKGAGQEYFADSEDATVSLSSYMVDEYVVNNKVGTLAPQTDTYCLAYDKKQLTFYYNADTTLNDINQYLIGLSEWNYSAENTYLASGCIAGIQNFSTATIVDSGYVKQIVIGETTYYGIPLYMFTDCTVTTSPTYQLGVIGEGQIEETTIYLWVEQSNEKQGFYTEDGKIELVSYFAQVENSLTVDSEGEKEFTIPHFTVSEDSAVTTLYYRVDITTTLKDLDDDFRFRETGYTYWHNGTLSDSDLIFSLITKYRLSDGTFYIPMALERDEETWCMNLYIELTASLAFVADEDSSLDHDAYIIGDACQGCGSVHLTEEQVYNVSGKTFGGMSDLRDAYAETLNFVATDWEDIYSAEKLEENGFTTAIDTIQLSGLMQSDKNVLQTATGLIDGLVSSYLLQLGTKGGKPVYLVIVLG